MPFNIAELVGQYLSPQILGRLGPSLGISPEAAQRASGFALPPLLAGIARHGSTEAGARQLIAACDRDGVDPAQFSAVLEDPSRVDAVRARGSSFLSSLFGERADTLTTLIGSQSGIGGGTAKGMLSMLAPLALGVIGKHVRSEGLDARGLSTVMSEQQGMLSKLMPAGLASALGIGGLREVVPERPTATTAPTEPMHHAARDTRIGMPELHRRAIPPTKKKAGLGWLVPVLGLLLVAFLGYRALKPRVENERRAERPTATAPVAVRGPTGVAAVDELNRFVSRSGNARAVPKTFNLGGLEFAQGSSDLPAGGTQTVDRLAKVLDEHSNVAVRLEGHTSARGDASANEVLSRARAEAVRRELVKRGVSPSRIEVAGLGGARPIAPGDSPQAQNQNSRIEVIVTEM